MAKVDPRSHLIYRGCTRPATILGVPVNFFIVSIVSCAVPGFWLINVSLLYAILIWSVFPVLLLIMRLVGRKDPHALLQHGKRLSMRLQHANRRRWGAITYSPFRFDQ